MSEDFRVPLLVPQSQQPLFVKVTVPYLFPSTAPSIHVLHRVVHPKISKDGHYLYTDEKLQNWQVHNNLQTIIRQMHQEFQLNPPLLEEMVHLASLSEVNIVEE